MGNVYDTKFTKSPLNFIKSGERYSMKLFKKDQNGKKSGLLTGIVQRGDTLAWNPESSFKVVRDMMSKKSIRYVRYAYKRKGGLFNQMPERKKAGLIPRKNGLDTEKYGGYNKAASTFFTLIKLKDDIVFVPIDLIDVKQYYEGREKACEMIWKSMRSFYSARRIKNTSESEINFFDADWNTTDDPSRIIKINSLLEIDGLRFNLKGKGAPYMSVALATPLVLGREFEKYVKKIESFTQKYKDKKITSVSSYSGINKEMNVKLYKYIAEKCTSKPFCQWDKFKEAGETLIKGINKFNELDLTEQSLSLVKCLSVLKTGRSETVDLSLVGGVKNFHTERFCMTLDKKKYSEVYIIDQSPIGLYEKKSVNLLEL